MFTILLRAGISYDPQIDNYEDALFKEQYCMPTKKAIMRFLFGFTRYVGPSMDGESNYEYKGWKNIFEAQSEHIIKSYLISDKGRKSIPELKNALWA